MLDDTNSVTHPTQSFGMDSNWIIEHLMGGDKCDPVINSETQTLYRLIDERRLDEAEKEVIRLRQKTAGNKDDFQRAMSLIERIRMLGK